MSLEIRSSEDAVQLTVGASPTLHSDPEPLDAITRGLGRAAEMSAHLLRVSERAAAALSGGVALGSYLSELLSAAMRQDALLRCLEHDAHAPPTDLRLLLRRVAWTTERTELFHAPLVLAIDSNCKPLPAPCLGVHAALQELVINALEATAPGCGSIHMSLRQLTLSAGWRPELGLGEGEHACIVVSDEGVGMRRVALEEAFRDGFSTKPHGAGQGLSRVLQALRDTGGAMDVSSAPERGTRVCLYLPLSPRVRPSDAGSDAHSTVRPCVGRQAAGS